MTQHERLIGEILKLLDYYIPHDPERPTVWDPWRDEARALLQDRPEVQVPVGLSEDDLSDLLWQVENCQEDVKRLPHKLNYILDSII